MTNVMTKKAHNNNINLNDKNEIIKNEFHLVVNSIDNYNFIQSELSDLQDPSSVNILVDVRVPNSANK
jgi:hypothetical protein